MTASRAPPPRVRIEANRGNAVTPDDLGQMVEIAMGYFPGNAEIPNIVRQHILHADSARIARDEHGAVAGYSVASVSRRRTPFWPRPIRLVYQRMLYLSPHILYRGLGKRLLVATFRDLLGPLWPLRRFAVVCRTLNPVVARMMDLHTVSYPHFGVRLPDEIREFAVSLLPMLGAAGLDDRCRLLGTLEGLQGADYTEVWNRHLHRHDNSYERLMLTSAFTEQDGRIVSNGAFVFMVAYSRPLQFIRFLFH